MEIEYELTEDDYLKFNEFFVRQTKLGRRNIAIHRYFPPAAWVFIAVILVSNHLATPGVLVSSALVSVIWLLISDRLWTNNFRKRIRSLLRESLSRTALGMHRMVLSREGVEGTSETSDVQTKWEGVEKIAEHNSCFYFFTGPANAYIVPKRAFADEQAAQQFLETARHYREQAAGLEPAIEIPPLKG